MAEILYGTILRDKVQADLKHTIASLTKKPALTIIQVGSRPDSNAYIHQKKLFGEAIGAQVVHTQFEESVSENDLIHVIEKANEDKNIHGIIVQLPLPAHISQETVITSINPHKDVDGLTAENTKLLFDGVPGGHIPATARGIVSILEHYNIPLRGKRVVVVGRSVLVGKPTALALLRKDATVTIAHKETQDLAALTRTAEVLVVAIGDPEFITKKYLSEGQVVIDVGINVNPTPHEKRKLVGDVQFEDAASLVAAITPVPGGVGPMTVASVFQNLMDAYTQLEQ